MAAILQFSVASLSLSSSSFLGHRLSPSLSSPCSANERTTMAAIQPISMPSLSISSSSALGDRLSPSLCLPLSMANASTDAKWKDPSRRIGQKPPPDAASSFLFRRIVQVCRPLARNEPRRIIKQLLYLQAMNRYKPIYMHIDSTGTVDEHDNPIAPESAGTAVYDVMMSLSNEVHTFLVGVAVGQAALLLAAGTKGKRYMMPHAHVYLGQAWVSGVGEMPASKLAILSREASLQQKAFYEHLAEHTGNSLEKISELLKIPRYMNVEEAKELGLVDEIYEHGKHKIKAYAPPRSRRIPKMV